MRERGGLRVFQRLAGRTLVALDGTEYFCSHKLSCPQFLTRKGANWPKKGGVGYFLPKVPRMLLIWLMLMGCPLVCFARFCDTFRDVLARVERCGRGFGKGKDKDGPALVVFHPCLANSKYGQGHGKGRAPVFSSGLDEFSDVFLHGVCPPGDYFYCALSGVNGMQSWPAYFCGISGLFCWVWRVVRELGGLTRLSPQAIRPAFIVHGPSGTNAANAIPAQLATAACSGCFFLDRLGLRHAGRLHETVRPTPKDAGERSLDSRSGN